MKNHLKFYGVALAVSALVFYPVGIFILSSGSLLNFGVSAFVGLSAAYLLTGKYSVQTLVNSLVAGFSAFFLGILHSSQLLGTLREQLGLSLLDGVLLIESTRLLLILIALVIGASRIRYALYDVAS